MTFDFRHDVEILGPLLARPESGDSAGVELVSVADIVNNVEVVRRLPSAEAVEAVATKLGRASALFLTRGRQWAEPIEDGYEWEPRRDGRGASMRVEVKSRPAWSATAWGDTHPRHVLRTRPVAAQAARPGRYGPAGALELLRIAYGPEAHSATVKRAALQHADKLRRLAMLASEARLLFPELFGLAELSHSVHELSVTRKAAQAAAVEAAAPPADFVKGRTWTDGHRLAFIAAYDALIAVDMGKDAALAELAGMGWASSGATLAKRITEGNDARRRTKQGTKLRVA